MHNCHILQLSSTICSQHVLSFCRFISLKYLLAESERFWHNICVCSILENASVCRRMLQRLISTMSSPSQQFFSHVWKSSYLPGLNQYLGPSINGLVPDGNTKLCCRGFNLALFQSTRANKIDSEHTRGYKRLLPVCEA